MKKILKIIFYIIPFLSLIVIFNTESFALFGKISYYILIGMMFSRPLRDIFPKKLKHLDKIVRVRKELGIIVGVFAIAHVIGYFIASGVTYTLILNPDIWRWNNFIAWGFVAVIVNIPLLLTSNLFSIVKLGKYWKKLQYLAYVMFLSTILHVVFINDDWFVFNISLGIIYLLILLTAGFLNRKRSKESTSVRYLCVPCGWIYDESLGDPDSGVKPGTKFEDIPNSWVCPVCGVGKKDFIKINGEVKREYIAAKVSKLTYINEKNDVIELVINTDKKIESKKGQFITFDFENEFGEFSRAYSISETNGNNIYFLIKILENGKAGNIFKKIKVGDDLKVRGPFGDFLLKQNDFEKVFIATGTGLAPIYNMLMGLDSKSKKTLLFGVQTKQDLFYVDKLKNIENLKVEIFLSREQEIQKNHGNILYFNSRISLESLKNLDKNTEFYICGNLVMVNSAHEELKKYGFDNIYFEKF